MLPYDSHLLVLDNVLGFEPHFSDRSTEPTHPVLQGDIKPCRPARYADTVLGIILEINDIAEFFEPPCCQVCLEELVGLGRSPYDSLLAHGVEVGVVADIFWMPLQCTTIEYRFENRDL